jgi:hypothetical protein
MSMNSKEFYDYVKQTQTKYTSKNNKDIRIWYSIVEKYTENRIIPYRRNGLKFGFQEKMEDGTINTFKNYKITYNSNKAGNQLYFFANMKRKVDVRIRQLIDTGELKLKNNIT